MFVLRNRVVIGATIAVVGMVAPARAETVTGTVVTAEGKPVAGATVLLQEFDGATFIAAPPATTDADGKFSITPSENPQAAGIRAKYGVFLFAFAPGYGYATPRIKPGEPIRVTLSPEKVLGGTVVDAAGKPLAGVPVSLHSVQSGRTGQDVSQPFYVTPEQFKTKTDAAGKWELHNVPESAAFVNVLLDDPRFIRLMKTFRPEDPSSKNVVVARPGGSVSGTVTDATGKPVADVVVVANRIRDDKSIPGADESVHEFGSLAKTDANGSFHIGQLGTGAFVITADAKKQELVPGSVPEIAVVAGKTVAMEKPILLTPGALVTGTVVAKGTGKPVAGVAVYASDWSNVAQTGADGTYKIRVAPGDFVVNIGSQNEGYAYFNPKLPVSVKEGETKTLAPFELPPAVHVTLRVVGEDGKPAAGVPVRIYHPGWRDGRNENDSPKTDANGVWDSKNDPRAELSLGAEDPWEVRVGDGWEVVSPSTLRLDVTAPTTVIVRKVDPASRPRGRVVTPEGKPVANANVSVNSWVESGNGDTSNYKSDDTQTDADGRFVLPRFRPKSTVTISVNKPEHRYRSLPLITTAEDGKQPDLGEIVLTPLNGTVSGTVVGANGKPVPGAWVWSTDGEINSHTRTDAQGAFTLEHVPASGDVAISLARGTAAALFTVSLRKNNRLNLPAPTPPVTPAVQASQYRTRANALIASLTDEAEVGQGVRDNGQKGRDLIADTVAKIDIEAALKIGADKKGKVSEAVLSGILDEAIATEPDRCRELFVANVRGWASPWRTLWRSTDMTKAFAAKDPAFAVQCYDIARRQVASGIPEGWVYENMLVAKLAFLVNAPDVDTWEARAIELLTKEQGGNIGKGIASAAAQLAEGDGTRAAKLLKRLPKEKRTEVAGNILESMVRSKTEAQTLAANRLLDNWIADGTFNIASDEWKQGRYISSLNGIVKTLARTDPEAAYKLAKSSPEYNRWEALLYAASGQTNPAIRTKRYREALAVGQGPSTTARYPLCLILAKRTGDAALAAEMQAALIRSVASDVAIFDGNSIQTAQRLTLAVGQTAPDMCRFFIEATIAQMRQLNPDDEGEYWNIRNALQAMAMVAPGRAVEIANSLHDPKNQFRGKCEIARVLLTPREKWAALVEE